MSSVLIVGGYGTFTNELINKFYKENWRIYTLVSGKKHTKHEHVFEQFLFDYDSDSIKDIIGSCRPDVILFTGAYDPLYKWYEENVKTESLHYIAGLSNLLMSANLSEIRHFVYISSDKVFEDDFVIDINENMPAAPKSFKGMTISQGENLAMHFDQTTQMEVTVARIAHMYGIPSDRETCTDIYSKMCVKALISGRLEINAKKILSALYVKDAVEALYLLVKSPERKHPLYHISSKEEITEYLIAELIKENFSHPIDIADQTIGLTHRIVLANERFCEEFPFQVKYSYKEMIPQIIAHMKNHKYLFLDAEDKYKGSSLRSRFMRIFQKAVPYLESFTFFIPCFMLNNRAVGSIYFNGINVYLLYVLLFAVVHGRQQAIVASLLSVIGYCFRQMYLVSGFSVLININTYIWIAQVFIVGLTVGHLKDKFREMEEDKNDKIDFLTERLNDITVINTSNTKIKNYFADRLISSTESIGYIYNITSKLEKAETGEVLFAALDTLSEIMLTNDISIYLMSNPSYCRLASASSEKARSLGKSIAVENYKTIFEVLERKQVYINRTLDNTLPMMASALFNEKDSIRIVIFLWSIPYENMNLYHTNVLTVVGALLYSAVVREADYLDALAYRRFIPDTTILQEEAFREMVKIYKHAGEKGYAESCVFYVEGDNKQPRVLSDSLRSLLRDTDYVGAMSDGNLAILLTNTNQNEYIHVRDRLAAKNINTYMVEAI
jgi:RmlD substrate binding domain.